MTVLLSKANLTPRTGPAWSAKNCSSCFVAKSHTRTMPSSPPVANFVPSGLGLTSLAALP
jgi:hypothetical protein